MKISGEREIIIDRGDETCGSHSVGGMQLIFQNGITHQRESLLVEVYTIGSEETFIFSQ